MDDIGKDFQDFIKREKESESEVDSLPEKELFSVVHEEMDWEIIAKESFLALNRARFAILLSINVLEAALDVVGIPDKSVKREEIVKALFKDTEKTFERLYHVQMEKF